jgi:hypothetical protein
MWSLWRKAILDSTCHDTQKHALASQPGNLRQPLGAWHPDAKNQQSSPRWKAFFTHSSPRLFLQLPHRPHQHRQVSISIRLEFSLASFDLRGSQLCIPAHALPKDAASVQPTSSGSFQRVNRPSTPNMLPHDQRPTITSFGEHVDSSPSWRQDLLKGVFGANAMDRSSQHLLQGTQRNVLDHLVW